MPPTLLKVGTVREYNDTIEVLYPGEQAELLRPMSSLHLGPVRGRWRVSPAPGVKAWWLRMRYRVECALGLHR